MSRGSWVRILVPFLFAPLAWAQGVRDVAFQEGEVRKPASEPGQETGAPQSWSLSLQAGVLPSALHFQAMTASGLRMITPDPLALSRLSLSYDFYDPLYGQAAMEFASGGGIRIVSGSIDLGARVFQADGLDVAVEGGLLYSYLREPYPGFGTFNGSIGFRGGLSAHLDLCEQWSLAATVDYRYSSFDYSGTIVSGDRSARLHAFGLLLGVSLKF
jgi:hypothetical protein